MCLGSSEHTSSDGGMKEAGPDTWSWAKFSSRVWYDAHGFGPEREEQVEGCLRPVVAVPIRMEWQISWWVSASCLHLVILPADGEHSTHGPPEASQCSLQGGPTLHHWGDCTSLLTYHMDDQNHLHQHLEVYWGWPNAVFRAARHYHDLLHLPSSADLHCEHLGLGNTVYNVATCDFSCHLPRPPTGVLRRTLFHKERVTQGEPMQSAGWPKLSTTVVTVHHPSLTEATSVAPWLLWIKIPASVTWWLQPDSPTKDSAWQCRGPPRRANAVSGKIPPSLLPLLGSNDYL